MLEASQVVIDKLWHFYDDFVRLEQICRDDWGKQIYRGAQLVWKTKALIAENKLARAKELCTLIKSDV